MLMLFTYRFQHPVTKQMVALDCAASNREDAMRNAIRSVIRQNKRLQRRGVPARIPQPSHWTDLIQETPSRC